MKKLIIALVLVLFVLTGCNNDAPETNGEDNVVVVPFLDQLLMDGVILAGTSPDFPPFQSLDTHGNIIGFDIDMFEAVVDILNEQHGTNLTVEWVSLDFTMIIGALQAGQIDVGVSGFTFRADRDVIFSTPYIVSAQVVVVMPDSGITTIADLDGKVVGAGLGSTGESQANEIEGATVVALNDFQMLFVQLAQGQLDAVVIDLPVAQAAAAEQGFVILDEVLLDENMSVIIENNNTLLAEALNTAIAEFVGSDLYYELKAKWLD